MSTFAVILSFVLGVAFLAAGGTKLVGMNPHPEEFARYDLPGATPEQARLGVGVVEVLAAVLLVFAGLAESTALAFLGGLIILATMVGAIATHLRLSDPPARLAPAGLLAALAVLLLVTAV